MRRYLVMAAFAVTEPDPPLRPLSVNEAGVLQALLRHHFAGVEELRVQARDVLARPGCGCGCGTIHLFPQGKDLPASPAQTPVRVQGQFPDQEGQWFGGILLFLASGQLAELEVHSFGDPLPMPNPDQVLWFLRTGESAGVPLPNQPERGPAGDQ